MGTNMAVRCTSATCDFTEGETAFMARRGKKVCQKCGSPIEVFDADERREEEAHTNGALTAKEYPLLAKIWDNPEDAVYDKADTHQEEMKASLEVLAELTGVPIRLREFVDDWVLMTYDIPHTPEGEIMRRNFLKFARSNGAFAQTESVYLLPWTPEANSIAMELAQKATLYLWYAKSGDKVQTAELTRAYDVAIRAEVDKLHDRAQRIVMHAAKGHKLADKMLPETWKTFHGLAKAILARGDSTLADKMGEILAGLRFADEQAGKVAV